MNRTVKARTCKCGADILTGLDSDWAGIDTTLDARPVDNLGEFLAVAAGRRTYTLRPTATRGSHGREMQERNAHAISEGGRWPVHAEHRCGQPLPTPPAAPAAARRPQRDRVIEGAPF